VTAQPPADRSGPAPGPAHSSRSRSTRTKARKRALDILFEAELRGCPATQTLAERSADADPPVRDYTSTLVRGVQEHQAGIDARITAQLAKGWTLTRMPRVDRTAIRIATYEIDHRDDVPGAVAVSEAVELVGDLSTDESPGFVNGLLGAILASKQAPVHRDAG
jgi:transcription antitermination protein NusB